MNLNIIQRAGAFALALSLVGQVAQATSLDGTSSIVFQNNHHVFRDGDMAHGFVRLNNGFSILSGETATLDTLISISGDIDLRTNGQLQLLCDVTFDCGITLTRSGYLKGRGHVLQLKGDLSIPSSQTLYITGDIIIDGGGHVLTLEPHARIFIEHNTTLTLRNMTFKNTRNNNLFPWIQFGNNGSKLALDNAEFVINNDFDFKQGQIYVHNDVAVTGSHAFIYHSLQPSFVAPASTLYFDLNTNFSFAPVGISSENLIKLQAPSSTLQMCACCVRIPGAMLNFPQGKLIMEDEIAVHRYAYQSLSNLSTVTSLDYGNTSSVYAIAWHPNARVLAIGGASAANGVGGFANTHELRLYDFDGTQLTAMTSQGYGTRIESLAWSPDGNTLAVAGSGPTNGAGGFANTHELRLYSFNGSSLTALTSQGYGASVQALAWSPDGRYLALAGQGPVNGAGGFANSDELRIYSFNGSTLTTVDSKDYGFIIRDLSWHPSGRYLVVGGSSPTFSAGGFATPHEVRMYSFDGSALTALTSQYYGGYVAVTQWSPDGNYLAIGGRGPSSGVGGFNNQHELRLYSFNGSTLTALASKDYGTFEAGTWLNAIDWSPNGRFLAISGFKALMNYGDVDNAYNTRLYNFNGTDLTVSTSQNYGVDVFAIKWDPTGKFMAVAGSTSYIGAGGFDNTDEVRLYSAELYNEYSPSRYAKATQFGNSKFGGGIL